MEKRIWNQLKKAVMITAAVGILGAGAVSAAEFEAAELYVPAVGLKQSAQWIDEEKFQAELTLEVSGLKELYKSQQENTASENGQLQMENSTWDGEVREAEAAENTTDEVDSENTECESESAVIDIEDIESEEYRKAEENAEGSDTETGQTQQSEQENQNEIREDKTRYFLTVYISEYFQVNAEALKNDLQAESVQIQNKKGETTQITKLTCETALSDAETDIFTMKVPVSLREEYRISSVKTDYPLCQDAPLCKDWEGPEDKNDVLSNFAILPLFHLGTFICLFSWPFKGWALNLCSDLRNFYRDLGLMHSDSIAVAPVLMESIYKDVKRGRADKLNGLWNPCGSSAMFDSEMLLGLVENGMYITQCYGMTETCGDGLVNYAQAEPHIRALGKPDGHCEYKLDETGEICIRGGCVMLGYYKDPEATAEIIDKDGWLHTGDLAREDEDGYYYMVGRKKNLIILGTGENVSPEELERKLNACPEVQECVVKEMGKRIGALICCAEEKQAEARAFITGLNRTLPLYQRITAVEFSTEPLPRNAMGKLLRR